MALCEELHPFITKKKTRFCNPVSVESQVSVTLYYLAEEVQTRKIANAFGLGKSTVSATINIVSKAIIKNLASKYTKLPITDDDVLESAELFYTTMVFPNA